MFEIVPIIVGVLLVLYFTLFYFPRPKPKLDLMKDLHDAIYTNQLTLMYQPQLHIDTNVITGIEVLVRWEHPTLGTIPPDEFVTQSENSNIINELTCWVADTAIKQCVQWEKEGYELSISVNLSARNLPMPNISESMTNMLNKYGLDPHRLTFELTETANILDIEQAKEVLFDMSRLGIKFAIDDFGVGYAPLVYLQAFPISEIKLDKQFIDKLFSSKNDRNLVKYLIKMAHSLNMIVIAEGVENQKTYDILKKLKCDCIQGYFISPPLSSAGLMKWLDQYKT